jgi:hypothetical protein
LHDPKAKKYKTKKVDQRIRKIRKLKEREPPLEVYYETLVEYLPDKNVMMNYIESIKTVTQESFNILKHIVEKGIAINHSD